ncbi:MAG: putative ABC transporter permease subunit, partial [Planctomycetota bacterium]
MKPSRTPPLIKLIAARTRMIGHVVTGLRQGGVLKFAVVTVFGVVLVAVLFGVMSRGFRFLRLYPAAETLLPYLFSLYFLTMLLMLTFSNAVISFGALYRSPETNLLMAMPLEPHTVYNYKAAESLMFSSWAFIILGGPLLAAYGNYGGFERLDWTFYAAAAALVLPFVFVPAALGSVICMLLTRFFPRRPGRALGLFFAVAAMICLGAGVYLAVSAGLLEKQSLVNEAFVQRVMDTFAFSQSTWAPSYWVSEGLMRAAEQNWSAVAFHWGLIASTAAFLWMAGDFLAEKVYAASYSRSSGAPARRLYRVGGFLDRLGQAFSGVSPVTSRLVVKDVRTFTRDPVQWSQVLIFFGLLFIYVANLRTLGYQRIVLEHIQNLRWT